MNTKLAPIYSILVCLLLLAACGPPKQKIPVSSDPIGAMVYADGVKTGPTPTIVKFDKQRDHLITIIKDGYEQEEIIIRRQFKPDKAIRDGIISGIIKGGDPKDVAGATAKEVDDQERSGEAYELTPSIVTIKLRPVGQGI
ncbi:PEGA domain-containing protein [Pseudodesulfovibrio sediminis]|uniref:PEGA domain-containing protein n=1 Tax=Pseudodesulfovibrio sediminis TaxID=2810563 RepID=A0ABN6ERX6_9BACT|nr:PEGA domain-containing protein [Pseudodesulfovibrio sediminis]BCS88222.1 hypothetical protein PSDVSF_14640 [Pseudodesulfovibrio sediminis]